MKMRMRPTTEEIESGRVYMIFGELPRSFWNEEEKGGIYRLDGTKIWEYQTKNDFVLTNLESAQSVAIRRKSLFSASFEMSCEGKLVAEISMTTALRNKYEVKISSSETWTAWMPLFTIYFGAASAVGENLWIKVGPSKRQWTVLFKDGSDSPELLCALTFIHWRWWRV